MGTGMTPADADGFLKKLKTSVSLKIFFPILGIAIGLFAFILPDLRNIPAARDEAQSYTGYFESFDLHEKYSGLRFSDGAEYRLHPDSVSAQLSEALLTMEKGTKLSLLINPNNHYIAEIRTETDELLNFEASQQAIFDYNKGYIGIGAFSCIAPVALVLLTAFQKNDKSKKAPRRKKR